MNLLHAFILYRKRDINVYVREMNQFYNFIGQPSYYVSLQEASHFSHFLSTLYRSLEATILKVK